MVNPHLTNTFEFRELDNPDIKPFEYDESSKRKTPTYSWVRNLHDGSVCILAKVTMHEFVWTSTKEVAYTKQSIHNSPPKMQKVYNVESLIANELTNMVNINIY